MRDDDWPDMMTIEEAAPRLRLTPAGLRRMVRNGVVAGTRVGKRWLISKDEVKRVLREGTKPIELAGGREHPRVAPEREQREPDEDEDDAEMRAAPPGERRYVVFAEPAPPRVVGGYRLIG